VLAFLRQVSNFILTPRASRSGHFDDDDDNDDTASSSAADKEQENVPHAAASKSASRRPSHTRSHSDMIVAATLATSSSSSSSSRHDTVTPNHQLTRAKSHSPAFAKSGGMNGSGVGMGAAGLLHSPYAKIRGQASHSLEVRFALTFADGKL
jgi:hypothetical protein